MPTNLADLLLPATQADLLSWIEARRFGHLPGENSQRWSHLFSWRQLGDLIARRQVSAADLRIFSNGRMVSPNALGILDGDGELRPMALQNLTRQGVSLAVGKIQGSNDALWALACDVERRLGDRTSITAIASFSSATAMPRHYDAQDILILQIDGRKHWSFFGEPVAGSGVSRPLPNQPTDVTGQVTLEPGDVLFVPSGQHHQCRPEGRSLHLSILVRRLTGQDLADYLRRRILDDPVFDTPIPRGQHTDILLDYERMLKTRLSQLIEETRLAVVIEEIDAAQQGVTGLDLIGRDPAERASARIVMLPRRRLVLPEQGSAQIGGRSVTLSPALRTALGWLNETGSLVVAEMRRALAERYGADEADGTLKALIDLGIAAVQAD